MPMRPPKICLDCHKLVYGGAARCPEHTVKRPSGAQQGYGRPWRRIRDRYLEEHPWCVSCGTIATMVDHIRPKLQGGTDDETNLQALCASCHARKTARDGSR
jgi:5-methylcytosine-specific restriction enzyme A